MPDERNTIKERGRKFAQPVSACCNTEFSQIEDRVVLRWTKQGISDGIWGGWAFFVLLTSLTGIVAFQDGSHLLLILFALFVALLLRGLVCFKKDWQRYMQQDAIVSIDCIAEEIYMHYERKSLKIAEISAFYNWEEADREYTIRAIYDDKSVIIFRGMDFEFQGVNVVKEFGSLCDKPVFNRFMGGLALPINNTQSS